MEITLLGAVTIAISIYAFFKRDIKFKKYTKSNERKENNKCSKPKKEAKVE